MPKPRLLYYDIWNYTPANQSLLHENFEVVSLPDPDHDTSEVLASVDALLAPLGWFCGAEKIERCPRLKVIGSNTTGDPHIDVVYARSKGLSVVTLKPYEEFLDSITPTAEMTVGLMVALSRNLVPAIRSVTGEARWERWPFGGERMLSRMSLGIIGLGRLGRKVAAYASSMGMVVRYFDPYVSSHDTHFLKVGSLAELVAESDIVSLHMPHEAETENLINGAVFAKC